jgi:hypothetical protein
MKQFWQKIAAGGSGPLENPAEAASVAAAFTAAAQADVYADSIAAAGGAGWALARRGLEKSLRLIWPAGKRPAITEPFNGPVGEVDLPVGHAEVLEVARTPAVAVALRQALPWTAPQLVAGRPSVGLGDRTGLATPGHVRAVRGTGYVPMLAQQSIREMTRTRRSAQEVVDDATWGVFQAGWRDGFGANADHLKTAEDIDRCAEAGFTFFTIDPGEHVDNSAATAAPEELAAKFEALTSKLPRPTRGAPTPACAKTSAASKSRSMRSRSTAPGPSTAARPPIRPRCTGTSWPGSARGSSSSKSRSTKPTRPPPRPSTTTSQKNSLAWA